MAAKPIAKPKVITATFYATKAGAQPARDWLRGKALTDDDRRIIGADIRMVETEWPTVPVRDLVKNMGDGIWEVRSDLDKRISRVLFGVSKGRMVVLHGFIKKSQATPKTDLDLARDRWTEWKKSNP